MKSARVLWSLHILLVVTFFADLLVGTGNIYASDDLVPAPAVVSKYGVSNTHSEGHERPVRHGSGNESQKALDQSLPPYHSMADAYVPLLAQVSRNDSQFVFEASPMFSGSTWNLPLLAITVALSTKHGSPTSTDFTLSIYSLTSFR
ncbi:hypothetical protein BDZ45DRAFT_281647 [Acephala macrosclerotiorum]|nr:hypothetical protein BDZ45DRAFT_281647 [Acephala macrosclerotiorum]